MLVHEYLRWKPKPVIPPEAIGEYNEAYAMWLLRNKDLLEYKNYLELFNPPEEETNIPKLQIFKCEEEFHEGHPNCCPVMIGAVQACNYDKKTKEGKAAEDVAEFDGDDPYDDLRYALDSAERYFVEAASEFERIQKQEQLMQTLQNTQDWTAYYRNMRNVESSTSKIQVVRRFAKRH